MSDSSFVNLDETDFGFTVRGQQPGDRVFGRFILTRMLGRGGMGVVWLAKDELLDREVALKFAPAAMRDDDEAIEELKRETKRGLDLSHPNIVKFYDFVIDDHNAAISMEFVDGETLAKLRVKQAAKVFEPRQVEHWVGQLLSGLSYAHRTARIVHRDLKPPNLLISQKGELKIMDFGISRSIQDSMLRVVTIAGNSTGTLAYMSPQQALGRSASVSDDLYSFGSTLYELFTGKPPFYTGDLHSQIREETPASITERRREFNLIDTEPFPELWEDVIRRCLAKQPESRPADVDEVARMLGLDARGFGGGAGATSIPMMPDGQAGDGTHAHTGHSTRYPTIPVVITQSPAPTNRKPSAELTVSGQPTGDQPLAVRKSSNTVAIVAATVAFLLVVGGGAAAYFMLRPKAESGTDAQTSVAKQETPVKQPDSTPATSNNNTAKAGDTTKPASDNQAKADTSAAKGDGTAAAMTPSTPAVRPPLVVPDGFATVQAAIDAAKPGETVLIKTGRHEGQIRLPAGVSLAAEQAGRAAIIVDGRQGSCLEVESAASDAGVSSVKGLVFAHSASDMVPDAQAPVVNVLASTITFEDCSFEGGLADGISISGTGKVQLIRCQARKNAADGFVVQRGGNAVLEECLSELNGRSGVRLMDRGSQLQSKGITAQNNNGMGVIIEAGGYLYGKSLRCLDNMENGFALKDPDSRAELDEALFKHNGYSTDAVRRISRESGKGGMGIWVETSAILILSNSRAESNAKRGISLMDAGNETVVRGCTVEANSLDGIVLMGKEGQSLVLQDTESRKNGKNGVAIAGERYKPKLLSNRFVGNTQFGIYVEDKAEPELSGTVFTDNHAGTVQKEGAGPGLILVE